MGYNDKTAKDKYDAIINTIEKYVKESDKNNKEIIKEAFDEGNAGHFEVRQQRCLISFMTNYSMDEYVDYRRMINIYRELIGREKWKIDDLIDRTKLSQKAFILSFEKHIGMTPSEAFKVKDISRIQPPSTWDYISGEKQNFYEKAIIEEDMTTTFGLKASPIQLAEAFVAQNLEKYYGLNRLEAELAFRIAKDNSLGFEDTFKYVYNYVWKFIMKPEDCTTLRDEGLEEFLLSKEVIHLYFVGNLSFLQINDAINAKIHEFMWEPLTEIDGEKCLRGIRRYHKSKEEPRDDGGDYYLGEYEPDWDAVEGFYSSGMRDFCEVHMQENGDVDMDDYEAQQDWADAECPAYNECDFWAEDYYEFTEGCDSINNFEVDDVNDFEEFDYLCTTIDSEDKDFKGDIDRRLPEHMEKLVNYDTRHKWGLLETIESDIGLYELIISHDLDRHKNKTIEMHKNETFAQIQKKFEEYKKLCTEEELGGEWVQIIHKWIVKQQKNVGETRKKEEPPFNVGDMVIIDCMRMGKISKISDDKTIIELINGKEMAIDLEYLFSKDQIKKIE